MYKVRKSYSFCDDILGTLPWRTRRERILGLGEVVWWSNRRRSEENYCEIFK